MKCKICGSEENPSNWVKDWKDSILKYQMCHTCNYWRERLEDDKKYPPHTACMIDGTHYVIGPEDDSSHFRGFSGARFQIEFNDGTKVVTTNLWCQGEPRGYWREQFPDNARFENNLKWKKVGECSYLLEEN